MGFFVAVDVGPKEVPQVAALEVASDFRLIELQLVNTGAPAVSVWVYDGETPPMYLLSGSVIQATESITGNFPRGRLFRGGLMWRASGPGVHGFVTGDQSVRP